eukprot:CAMPEP_0202477226 /NCGR_PEP_ID=MMETSP1360-20130828/93830_1 /ASSEMBLY_ACC=CAM_ASM_000848 /TAXON_ID=515479 /ORGANISM="Licmophora paradoxa, Strain CCMP2313" /LENGTH=457 /DNA_ID=CAMNT_0049104463 /DNA_START=278 /DNA_END=1652 /DNA_ORIENTATION=-
MNLGVLDEDADNNTTPSLTDKIFNIQVDNAVQLFRNVEVYQWVEQEIDADSDPDVDLQTLQDVVKENSGVPAVVSAVADSDPDVDLQTLQDRRQRKLRRSGGGFSSRGSSSSGSKGFSSSAGTSSYRNHYYSSPGGSYFYYTGWNTGLRPTSHFTNTIDGVENPETALFPLRRYIHPLVLLNEHLPLNEELLLRMDWWTYIFTLSLSDLPENTTASNGAKLYDSIYYFYGDDVTNASIGNTRVSFGYILPGQISIMAKWNGTSFEPYQFQNGKKIFHVRQGVSTANAVFADVYDIDLDPPSVVRIAFSVLVIIGCFLLWPLFTELANRVTVLQPLSDWSPSIVLAITMALTLIFFTLGLIWVTYVPSVGAILLGLMGVMLACSFVIVLCAHKKTKANSSNYDDGKISAFATPSDEERDTVNMLGDDLGGSLPKPSSNAAAYLQQMETQEEPSKPSMY